MRGHPQHRPNRVQANSRVIWNFRLCVRLRFEWFMNGILWEIQFILNHSPLRFRDEEKIHFPLELLRCMRSSQRDYWTISCESLIQLCPVQFSLSLIPYTHVPLTRQRTNQFNCIVEKKLFFRRTMKLNDFFSSFLLNYFWIDMYDVRHGPTDERKLIKTN